MKKKYFWIFVVVISASTLKLQAQTNVSANRFTTPSTTATQGYFFNNYSSLWRISMGNTGEYKLGPVQNFSIKSFSNAANTTNGWTWGANGATPVAALSNIGILQLRNSLYFDGQNSRIGIGTVAPSEKLEILDGNMYLRGFPTIYLHSKAVNDNRLSLHHNSKDAYIDYKENIYFRYNGTVDPIVLNRTGISLGSNQKLTVGTASIFTNSDKDIVIQNNHPGGQLIINSNISLQNNRDLSVSFDGKNDNFLFMGKKIGYYSIGWYDFNNTAPDAVLTSYGAIRFLTGGKQAISIFGGALNFGNETNTGMAIFSAADLGLNYIDFSKKIYFRKKGDDSINPLTIQDDGSVCINCGVSYNNSVDHTKSFNLYVKGQSFYQGNITVDGKLEAEAIEVKNIDLPDYVFSKDYKLRTLEEVENHILKEGNLPEMPKAADVAEKGMNLTEMNNLLLKKVEELTLYIIEMKKEMNTMQKQINGK
ncbi:MAG: hypothetical protein SNJ64_03550 [Endomicrobiia bacterium]